MTKHHRRHIAGYKFLDKLVAVVYVKKLRSRIPGEGCPVARTPDPYVQNAEL